MRSLFAPHSTNLNAGRRGQIGGNPGTCRTLWLRFKSAAVHSKDTRFVIDFQELSFTVTGFFTLLGFPDDLAERAAGDAEASSAPPFGVDTWTPYSGATYVLPRFSRGKVGISRPVVRIANDSLFNLRRGS